jgi:hypothetical protein
MRRADMTRIAFLAICVALAVLPAVSASGQGQMLGDKPVATARYTTTPPTVDGQMGADEWSAAIVEHVDFDSPTVPPGIILPDFLPAPESQADLSFDIRALYDDDNLYVAIAVADDIVIHDSENWVDDDSVQLWLDGDREVDSSEEYGPGIEWNEIGSDVNGDTFCQACSIFGQVFDWESAPGLTANGYVIEFRIALGSIDVVDGPATGSPRPGDNIGLNVVVEDDDNGGLGYNQGTPGNPPVPSDGHFRWTSFDPWADSTNWGLLYFEPRTTQAEAETWGQVKQTR